MEIPEKVRNSERHAHGWKDREISERMSIRTTMFRFAGKSPKIWKKSDHGESPVRPEKSPKSDGKSPKWRNSDGKSPKTEKGLWKKSDGESPMETGESPMEKVRSGRKKSCVGIFRWKKSEIRKKSENGPCVYSFFQKFHDEFNPHIFGPFRGPRPEIVRSAKESILIG